MKRYIFTRILLGILVVFIIATVTFFLMRAIPGGPFSAEKKVPEAIKKNLEAKYKLDQPVWRQYLDYMSNVIRGDFGPSFKYKGRTVNDFILEGFPISAVLGCISIFISIGIGIIIGIVSALNQNKWLDYVTMFFAILGVSIPSFIIASILMYVFAFKLRWLPPAMWGKPSQAILPAISLSGFSTAFFARMMRSSMLEVLQQDYIRTARAKGLPEYLVICRHAVKNGLIPVITYLGPLIAGILTGSFVVENIFAIPGLGKYYVSSITNRDYTTILGVTIFYSVLLVSMNILVDIAYAIVDPRIKLVDKKE